MDGMTVLCVENRLDYLDTLKSMLEGIGYEVVGATSAEQALDLLTRGQVDGVLLEYDLPDATGSAVRVEMKRIKPYVPVVLFSGVGMQTPSLLRFFDAYLRSENREEEGFEPLVARRVGRRSRSGSTQQDTEVEVHA